MALRVRLRPVRPVAVPTSLVLAVFEDKRRANQFFFSMEDYLRVNGGSRAAASEEIERNIRSGAIRRSDGGEYYRL